MLFSRLLFYAIGFLVLYVPSWAQSSDGGLPLSTHVDFSLDPIDHHYALPVGGTPMDTATATASSFQTLPHYAGKYIPMDISFPSSGRFIAAKVGALIWQVAIRVPGAPAVGLYYDRFQLPPGVRLYLSNKTGTQLLGAYTAKNNAPDQLFACEAIQGDEILLEINIDVGVDLSKIKLHVNKGLAYFSGIEYLRKYSDNNTSFSPVDATADPYNWLEGRSSSCMIDAVCPAGGDYEVQRKSTVQLVLPGANGSVALMCSGTLINNTGNTDTANCKNYLLTASHCESTGAENNETFSQYLIRFNFEYTSCDGDSIAAVRTLTGADFVARTQWPVNPVREGMPDFLLLELREGIRADWGAYLSGWDRNPDMPLTLDSSQKYLGFHHPSGDVRKLSYSRQILDLPNAWSFQFPVDGSQGGVAGGSSGSGLFNSNGYLIGNLSVAAQRTSLCQSTTTGQPIDFHNYASYYMLSAAWEQGSDPQRQLRHWLDPMATGVFQLESQKACLNNKVNTDSSTSIPTQQMYLGMDQIALYPNPSSDGLVKVQFNVDRPTGVHVEVYAVSGKRVGAYRLYNVSSGSSMLDLSTFPKGVYLVKFYYGTQVASKKVMIR